MKRLVFLDLDGTVVTERQTVLDSTKEALARVREAGHLLWICTGRSVPEIYPWLWDLGFQGVIAANGAHARLDGEDLFDHRFSKDFITQAEQYFKRNGILTLWQTPDAMHAAEGYMQTFFEGSPETINKWADFVEQVKPYLKPGLPDGASKGMVVIPAESDLTLEKVEAAFEPHATIIPASIETGVTKAGEFMLPSFDKGTGIKEVAQILGFSLQDTVAVGDALNDLQMIQTAGIGIAMGNAVQAVKDVADHVTAHIEQDGLAKALEYAGLIH